MSDLKQAENGYQGGAPPGRALTPGGHVEDRSQTPFAVAHRRFANPAPLGLCGFAATTYMLSMYNINAHGVIEPNVVVGMAAAYGGLAQFVAGVWEFASGNTFGATAFCSYGAFWWSYAAIQIPWFGIAAAFGNDESQLASALGVYLSAWFVFTFIMLVSSLRSSVGLVLLFFFLDLTFLMLFTSEFAGASGKMTASAHLKTAGGALGVLTAAIAWYVASAGLLTPDASYFTLPVGPLSKDD